VNDQLALFTIPPPAPDGALERGLEGSELAARKWTPLEAIQVSLAIRRCVAELEEFTADDVWAALPDGFPVTKGLAGRLMAARYEGRIVGTGRVAISQREGEHGHGQRLAVWRSVRP
jgi:hypothetical protein